MAASIVSKILIRNFRNFYLKQDFRSLSRVFSCNGLPIYTRNVRSITCHSCLMSDKTDLPAPELKKSMESLTDKFAEAREMLDDARESQGTVYFSDDMEEAQTAVKGTLTEYKELLDKLSDTQRQQVISTLGLRMEELKAQLSAIEEALKD